MNGLFFNLEFSMSEAQDILIASATFFAGYSYPARTDHVISMVEQHDRHISIESWFGKGSYFTLAQLQM